MELKSLAFVGFAAVFAAVYFALNRVPKGQKYLILAGNIYFILCASGLRSLCIITAETLCVFLLGKRIEYFVLQKDKQKATRLAHIGVACLVGVLCYFKFFRDTFVLVQNLLAGFGFRVSALLSPIGISYYTLSMIAYLIDISHKKHPAEKNFFTFLTFITFFPSIVQGPINLYKKTASQFDMPYKPEEKRIVKGMLRSLWGYVKTIVIADRIGVTVMAIIRDSGASSAMVLWAMVLYSFQIYADFSGGIDVIMGFAEILDIKLTENFRAPLISRSVTEYWARWHMSLGEFMEKYIYYPIVLNRKVMRFSKKIRNPYLQKVFSASLASLIVFVIVGIWHGTGWNYVVYGAYQALFVTSAVLLAPVYKKTRAMLHIQENNIWWRLVQMVRTFCVLVVGRFFIRAGNLPQAFALMRRAFGDLSVSSLAEVFGGGLRAYAMGTRVSVLVYGGIAGMIFVDVMHERGIHFRDEILKQNIAVRYAIYLAALFLIIIFGVYGPGVDTSNFIYAAY